MVCTPGLPSKVTALMVIVFCLNLAGCSITQLGYSELQSPEKVQSGDVYVKQRASGFTGGRVGWGRITIFAIPIVPIYIHGDEAIDIMRVVSDSLTAAGYTTQWAGDEGAGPVLSARVTHARFNNYTWLAPIVPTWGRINMTLTLESSDGDLLWERSFEGKGSTLNFFDGYNIAATKSVTRLADSMIEAFGSADFYLALSAED